MNAVSARTLHGMNAESVKHRSLSLASERLSLVCQACTHRNAPLTTCQEQLTEGQEKAMTGPPAHLPAPPSTLERAHTNGTQRTQRTSPANPHAMAQHVCAQHAGAHSFARTNARRAHVHAMRIKKNTCIDSKIHDHPAASERWAGVGRDLRLAEGYIERPQSARDSRLLSNNDARVRRRRHGPPRSASTARSAARCRRYTRPPKGLRRQTSSRRWCCLQRQNL